MKKVEHYCDKCGRIIDGVSSTGMVGGGELCTLIYQGTMGHNRFPTQGLHYHYECFCEIMDLINPTK